MKRVLLTGATGFVGSHVVDAFAGTDVELCAFVRPASRAGPLERAGVELVRGTFDDASQLAAALAGVDTVIHLAALTHARSEAAFNDTNVEATRRLVRAALDANVRPRRFVCMSSLAAAGPSFGGRPVQPADPPRPITAYGRSKLAGESACREASDDLEVVVLRAPAVYGPRDREMLRFFRFARAGWIPLPPGAPRPLQLVHVADLARAIVLAASRPHVSGIFHIAEPRAYDMHAVARLIGDAIGRRVHILPLPAPLIRAVAAVAESANRAVGRTSMLNRDKVRELLAPGWLCETGDARDAFGFEARIALPDGLRETAAWYTGNGWLRA
jgi:nucleoside-diphosphate-sugar epimerase